MKINKIMIATSVTLALLLGVSIGSKADTVLESISAYLDHSIRIKLHERDFELKDSDGNKLEAINFNGNTYLPLRSVAEATGMIVKWDDVTRTATLDHEPVTLGNITETVVNITGDGDWGPSYITNVRKVYSNWYKGASIETISLKDKEFNDALATEVKGIEKYGKIVETKEMEVADLKGTYFEYFTKDSNIKEIFLESNNSKEYYKISVFVEKSKYDANKDTFDKVISTFRKLR